MARPRMFSYQGLRIALYRGQTERQARSCYSDHGIIEPLVATPSKDVKAPYYEITPWGLSDRSTRKRRHHKRRNPPAERPRFGPGSGRAGGARMAKHKWSHLEFWPNTIPATCPACLYGLAYAQKLSGYRRDAEADDYFESAHEQDALEFMSVRPRSSFLTHKLVPIYFRTATLHPSHVRRAPRRQDSTPTSTFNSCVWLTPLVREEAGLAIGE